MKWSDERETELRGYYADGLVHSEIAARMGITRNATIGKAHRLGLEQRAFRPKPRPKPWEKLGITERTWHRRNQKAAGRYRKITVSGGLVREAKYGGDQATELAPEKGGRPLTIVELGPHACRWPLSGEGAKMLFCGADKVFGHSYCPRHCEMAYATPRQRSEKYWYEIPHYGRRVA